MSSYLLNRNGHYYFRIRIPSDLSRVIPSAVLVKSLKTTQKVTAKVTLLTYLKGTLKVFSLYRSGFLSETQARLAIDALLNRRQKVTSAKPESVTPQVTPSELPLQPEEKPVLLSAAIKQYLNDKRYGWGTKTQLENDGSYRLTLDLLGDVDLRTINRLTVRDLRDWLSVLPANIYKLFPNQTAKDVLNRSNSDNPTVNIAPMSVTTVNKHISRFSSLMKHCMKEGYIDNNPAVGLKIKQKKRPDEERKAYSLTDLKSILSNLPPKEYKPERYWIPIISMFSGLRLDEVCQLHTDDIKQIEGIWCIDVNDNEDKKLKTLSSKRVIPIHPTLLKLGLLNYVMSAKSQRLKRLWSNLNWRKEDGYSNAFGKWFQRFNRQYVSKDPLKTFHSLRHTFADTLKQTGEQEALIAELMGHANGNITTGRYGKRYKPLLLLKSISKVDYSELGT